MHIARLGVVALILLAGLVQSPATAPSPATLRAVPDRASGVYGLGDTVEFEVRSPDRGAVTYSVRHDGGAKVAEGTLATTDGLARVQFPATRPGTLLLEVRSPSLGTRALSGAVVEPGRIRPASEPPSDFDAFWDAKVAEVARLPIDAKITAIADAPAGVEYAHVTLSGYRGSTVRAQLARPARVGEGEDGGGGARGEKFPAMLVLQWAGVYPLQRAWVTDRAAEGWLALNVSAHEFPLDLPEAEVKKLADGELKSYLFKGMEDREASYFLRMYLATHRAVEYLASRPDWDGRTLVVTGTSMGGQQSIVAAGLNPRVTAVLALVPAGCDTTGEAIIAGDRSSGYPYWEGRARTLKDQAADIRRTAGYFDVAHFAPRIKAPVLVGLGLIDTTCPPAGVLAMSNSLSGPVERVILVGADHKGSDNTFAPYTARAKRWMDALRAGDPVPPSR